MAKNSESNNCKKQFYNFSKSMLDLITKLLTKFLNKRSTHLLDWFLMNNKPTGYFCEDLKKLNSTQISILFQIFC